ncbi:MAG: mltD 1 [Burkholderiaceae bacterium]|nr:mltD 1 [Burkholderiaceae bacterium]
MLRILTKMTHLSCINAAKNLLICASVLLVTACATGPNGQGNGAHNVKPIHTNSNDLWQRIRDNYGMPDLYNNEVATKENYYASRADYVGRMTERSSDFLYLIMDEVERRRMPSELALLPFVESAFVTSAKSSAKASGLWQFMPATGRDYSLNQNRFSDQRNDVVASTDAALTYLQRLHDQFGDWHLALAAYNWGQGNVAKAVSRSYAAGGTGSYQDIKMPAETREYVPKLQAIKNIVSNPALYGITLPKVHNRARHEAVVVTRDIDVSAAAQLAGMSEEEFKRLNPAHKKPVIVAALGSKILVPTERADNIRAALSNRSRQLATLTTYTTYSSEALADIATKYNTDEYRLRELNSIPDHHNYIQANSTLIVPRINKNDEIPYIALNSSVHSSTGGAGFNNVTDPNASIYLAQSTPATTTQNMVTQANDTIRALPSTPKWIPNQESNTGLVAHRDDADNLSQLIKNPPSVPVAANNSLDTQITAKDVPFNLVKVEPTSVHILPDERTTLTTNATNTTEPILSTQDVPLLSPTVTPTAPVILATQELTQTSTAISAPITTSRVLETVPAPTTSTIAALTTIENTPVAATVLNKQDPKINAPAVLEVSPNPPTNETDEHAIAYVKNPSPVKNVVKTSNPIKPKAAPVIPVKKTVVAKPTTTAKSAAKSLKIEKNKDKMIVQSVNKSANKKEERKAVAKTPLKAKTDKAVPPVSTVASKNSKTKEPTPSLKKAKTTEKPTAKTVVKPPQPASKNSKTKTSEKPSTQPTKKTLTQSTQKSTKTQETSPKAKKK